MALSAAVSDRCTRCTSRDDLLTTAVVEAGRRVMAANLLLERAMVQGHRLAVLDDRTADLCDAWQDFRDALAAERASR